jgi:hypothetical protein
MSKNNSPDFYGVQLHAIEPHWDEVWLARRRASSPSRCGIARPSIPAALIRLEKCNYK